MGRWAIATLAVLSSVAGFAQTAAPQEPPAISVTGTVTNSSGEAVAGAAVILEDQAQKKSQQTKTNAAGEFSFTVALPGNYTIAAEKAGIRSPISDPLELSRRKTRTVKIILDIVADSVVPGNMEFADKPNFTVAGVTDWSGAGGHGSDTSLRTSESLARDTLALKSAAPDGSATGDAAKDADAHRIQGELDEKAANPLGAVREFELAATLDPSEQNYFAWGTELLLHRASAPAAVVFKKGASAHPTSARMLTGLGAALYAGGSYEQAANELCRASDLESGSAAPYVFLGKMEITAAIALPCAEEKLARFLRQQPGNAQANYYFAMALLKQRREATNSAEVRRAQELLEKAVAIDPKLGEAYLQLGILHAGQGVNERAIDAYSKAIEATPNLSEAHYRLSQLYKRTGEKAKADQEMQVYKRVRKSETDEVERQRREVQQFLVILKEPASAP
jgi:tetratricopeptide (TPR) repeat protein